jgi:hypothetical protein
MLSDEASEVQIAAANYLARIGDFDAVGPLLDVSKEWTSTEEDNPFISAIYQIMLRMSRQQAEATAAQKEQQEPNEPRKTVSPTITAKKPPKPSKKTVTYSGIVSNEAGKPIERVHIRSISYNEYMEFSGTEAEGRTDENGLFAVGPIDAQDLDKVYRTLIFEHPDYAIGWFNTKRGGRMMRQDGINISLLSPSVISGIVIDEQGGPVEGAVVEALMKIKSATESSVLMMSEILDMDVTTDTEGQFTFEKVPYNAQLHIDVSSTGYAYYSTRIEHHQTDDYPIQAGQENLVIILKPGGFIRGRLVMNSKPYEKEGVVILVQGEKGRAISQTDQAGQFETTGLAQGGYMVKALDKDFETEGLVSASLTDVTVEVPGEPTDIELVIGKGVPVIVKIVHEQTGKPVKNVRVWAAPKDAEKAIVAQAKSDVNGQCILKIMPDEYIVKAQGRKDSKPYDFSKNISVHIDDKDLSVEIHMTPRRTISGLLMDIDGNTITGTVSLDNDSVNSNEAGLFELAEPWGDQSQIHIGFAYDRTKQFGQSFFWSGSDNTYDLELILEPLATILGRVLDKNGAVIEQVEPQLRIRLPGGRWHDSIKSNPWKLTVTSDGQFQFEGVPIGLEMDIHVEKPGFEDMAEVGSIFPGETVDVGDILLKALPGFENTQAVLDSNNLDIQAAYDVNTITTQ